MILSKQLKSALVLSIGMVFTSASHAAIQNYEITGSWSNKDACLQTASQVVDAFKNHSSIISSDCIGKVAPFTLQVAFYAAAPLELISTISKYVTLSEYRGGYASQEICEASLSDELAFFKSNTGLEPFVALCFNETKDSPALGPYDWNIRIEAVGPAPAGSYVPSEIAVNPFGFFLTPEEQVRADISRSLAQKGIRASLVHVHHTHVLNNLIKIRSYNQKSIELGQSEFVHFADGPSCLNEANNLKSSAYATNEQFLAAFCMSDLGVIPKPGEPPVASNLRVVFLDSSLSSVDKPQKLPGGFRTYAKCSEQRLAIVSKVETAIGKSVRASMCGQSSSVLEDRSDEFFVHIIE